MAQHFRISEYKIEAEGASRAKGLLGAKLRETIQAPAGELIHPTALSRPPALPALTHPVNFCVICDVRRGGIEGERQ